MSDKKDAGSSDKKRRAIIISSIIGFLTLIIAIMQLLQDNKALKRQNEGDSTSIALMQDQLDVQIRIADLQEQALESDNEIKITQIANEIFILQATLESYPWQSHKTTDQISPIETPTTTFPPVQYTSTLEITPTHTVTPPPFFTPTPSFSLPFIDNFDLGYREEWVVVNGNPIVSNGKLGSATEWVTLEIGNNSLGDSFIIKFDFEPIYPRTIYIVIGGKLRYYSGSNSSKWEAFEDNRWVEIVATTRRSKSGHLQVTVDGNRYSVYLSDPGITDEMAYGDPLSGPIILGMQKDFFIDNFQITR